MRIAAAVTLLALVAQASAQTAFTYQGELINSGAAASGLHDMRFRLFGDDGSGPTQIGPTLCADNVVVADGRFTTTLDFGAQFSGSNPRFLEIEVRQDSGLSCANLGGFTVLSPRQQVTSAPRATSALAAASANRLVRADGTTAVSVANSGNVGVATTLPAARLHVADGDIVAGASGQEWMFHTRSSFAGDFLQITDADAGLFQFQRGLVVHQNGNVGVGTTLPIGKLDVASGGGSYFRVDAPNGDIRVNGGTDGFFGLVNEGAAAGRTDFISSAGVNLSINNSNGNVGIGSAPDPSRKLYVNGQIGIIPTFRVKSIHGSSFLPDTVGRDSGGFGLYDTLGVRGFGFGGSFIAPVELPDGCQVQRIDLTFADSRPTDFTLTFGRTSTTTGVVSNITSITTSGESASIRVAGVDLGGFGIGNNSNVYWLRANLDSFGAQLHQIVAVRITYTVTSPLP
jgi:hypothetical protein